MADKMFWCIFASETDLWWTDAEEIEAQDENEAAENFMRDFGDGDEDDCDEVDVIVASDRSGTDAKRISVTCYVERSYSAGESNDDVSIPEGSAEMPGDDGDDGEVIKGTQDDQTLSLFG